MRDPRQQNLLRAAQSHRWLRRFLLTRLIHYAVNHVYGNLELDVYVPTVSRWGTDGHVLVVAPLHDDQIQAQ